MKQEVFYITWTGDLGTYRLDFFAADDSLLDNPMMIELPEDMLICKKFDSEFDKLPIGMAKAPALELSINLAYAYQFAPKFAAMFVSPTVDLDLGLPFAKSIVSGTIIKLTMPGGFISHFMVREEIEIELDAISGMIDISAVHWAKCGLDSIDFSPMAKGYFNGTEFESWVIYETHYQRDIGNWYAMQTVNNKDKFRFIRLSEVFNYISIMMEYTKRKMFRIATASYTVNMPDFKAYKQNYVNPVELGDALDLTTDIYILAFILRGTKLRGGLFADGGGMIRYKSAWDFLSEISENFLMRAYVTDGNAWMRPLLGRAGIVPSTIDIESDQLASAKLTVNYHRVGVCVGSRGESAGQDMPRYESTRAASRAGNEFTVPVIFQNTPQAVKWQTAGNRYLWRSFFPLSFGLYYVEEGAKVAYKAHHYIEFRLSDSVWSGQLPGGAYGNIGLGWADELWEDPALYALRVQSYSGIAKWSAETMRAVYDRAGQAKAEIEYKAEQIIDDPFLHYYTLEVSDIVDYIGVLSDTWQALSYEFDFTKESLFMNLTTVPSDAI